MPVWQEIRDTVSARGAVPEAGSALYAFAVEKRG